MRSYGKHLASKPKRKLESSKKIVLVVIAASFLISQESILLIAYAIYLDFSGAASYLTAAVGLPETVIAACLSYFKLSNANNSEGGITFEAAKATGFTGGKKTREFSKILPLLVIAAGFIIANECLVLIAYALYKGFVGSAAFLTAAVSLASALIGSGLSYLLVAKSNNTEGGITFEAAKANGFSETAVSSAATDNYNVDSPPI